MKLQKSRIAQVVQGTFEYIEGKWVEIGTVAVASMSSVSAFAAAPATVADLTTGIDFSTVALGVLAVTGILIGYYLTKKGAKEVVNTVKTM
jgi:hypothetical protein